MKVTFDFGDAHVLVTGGSSGIGLAIARAFAEAGAHVTITGTRAERTSYEDDLSAFEYRICQMRDAASIEAVARSLARLDVLVNNAGQNLPGRRSEWEPAVFEEVVDVNLVGAFRMSTACKPLLVASRTAGGASVVNMGSMTSYFGLEVVPGYGAAKAAIVQLTKTMAVAWARDSIRVNAVAPGTIDTKMTHGLIAMKERSDPILQRTPMRRFGAPADVAPAVLFLASPAAAYVTGQTLPVDGGFSVQC